MLLNVLIAKATLLIYYSFDFGFFLQAQSPIKFQFEELPKPYRILMGQSFSCGKELGPAKLKNLPSYVVISHLTHYPEDNDSFNAVWGCVFKKKRIVNENSEINQLYLEYFLTDLLGMYGKISYEDQQLLHNMAKRCSTVRGNDYGQTAVKIYNCIFDSSSSTTIKKIRNSIF